MRITAITVRKRMATSLIIISLIVLGLYGLLRLPVDFLPDITHPLVRVIVYWRGATPEEIEFMQAFDEYKRKSGRMFPTCSEVLEVLVNLGYEKKERACSAAATTPAPMMGASHMSCAEMC